jgi:hypothetical protein
MKWYLDDPYWKCCLKCGRSNEEIPICPAIILSANPSLHENFTCFGERYGYETRLDITSVRNFIPLCGSSGTTGTCRWDFDNFELALLYDPFKSRFYFIDKYCVKYSVDIPDIFYPYRRLLAWRARRSTMFSLKFEWLATFCERPASTKPLFRIDEEIFNEEMYSLDGSDEDYIHSKTSPEIPNIAPTEEIASQVPAKRQKTNV